VTPTTARSRAGRVLKPDPPAASHGFGAQRPADGPVPPSGSDHPQPAGTGSPVLSTALLEHRPGAPEGSSTPAQPEGRSWSHPALAWGDTPKPAPSRRSVAPERPWRELLHHGDTQVVTGELTSNSSCTHTLTFLLADGASEAVKHCVLSQSRPHENLLAFSARY